MKAERKPEADEGDGADNRALLEEIRERRDDAFQADQDNVTAAQSDLQMLGGDQWPSDIKLEREQDNRPVVTQNELPQFVRQVVGDMRAQRPSVKVNPDGGGSDKKVADIYTGIIRDIEAKAASARPYITAGASAARCGIGHWRILHDYENDKSFDQCIKLEGIDDPFAVLWDPLATNITRSDANYCFVNFLMSEDDFKRNYPEAQDIDFDTNEPWSNDWLDRSARTVRVCEYWRKRPTTRTLVELADGFVGYQDEFEKNGIVGPVAVKRSREVESFEVECIKTNGFEVLEEPKKWPTRHIPIIAVVGEEFNVGEKRIRHSVIRFAKDAQQLLNYWLSQQTEYVALQPKAPYIATAKQIGAYKDMWTEANIKNRPVLIFDADPQAPGAPQRAQPPVSAQGISEQIMLQKDALRATTGIYSAGLGERSNETSGKAIMARQREGDVGTSEYLDNLAASIAYTGEIIVDLIPFIYDTERQIRVLAEDGAESFAEINQRMQTPEGEQIINALAKGKYAVSVTTGPSYTTKRQEAAESMMMFVQAHPQAAQIVLDLIAKNMDWPGADQFAERFKKMLPANLQPETDDPEEQQARQAAQQQAQEAEQIQKAGLQLEMEEKSAQIERTRAETQKLLMPEAPKQPDPLEVEAKHAEFAIKGGELRLKEGDQAIKHRELDLRVRELEMEEAKLAFETRQKVIESDAGIERENQTAAQTSSQNGALAEMLQQVMGVLVQMPQQQATMFSAVLGEVGKMMNAEKEVVRDPSTGRAVSVRVKRNSGAI